MNPSLILPKPSFGMTSNQTSCLILQSSFWFAKNIPDGLNPIPATSPLYKLESEGVSPVTEMLYYHLNWVVFMLKAFSIAVGVRKWRLMLKRVNRI